MEAYCVNCLTEREMRKMEKTMIKLSSGNIYPAVKGECVKCGRKIRTFINSKNQELVEEALKR